VFRCQIPEDRGQTTEDRKKLSDEATYLSSVFCHLLPETSKKGKYLNVEQLPAKEEK
jgi:hypothetical protein